MIDWHDSNQLSELADENIHNAKVYAEARVEYSKNKFALDRNLANSYMNLEIDTKVAYEKAILLLLIGAKKEENELLYNNLLHYESVFKGLERVMEANKDKLVLSMALIKNIPK